MKFRLPLLAAFSLTFATILGSSTIASAHLIIEAKGQVKVKTQGASNFRGAGVGTKLQYGDLLYPSASAKVTVLCNNNSIWKVPAGVPSGIHNGCPDKKISHLRKGREEIVSEVGGNEATIPYLISPRYTNLLADKPTFRWNRVEGANSYTVSLYGIGGLQLWQQEVNNTEVVYPDDAPSLQRGITYLLTVETDTGQSSLKDGGSNLGFVLLGDDDTLKIEQAQAQITSASNLTTEQKALALAELYRDNNLFADAIETLETIVNQQQSPNGLIYLMLGDLYMTTGLNLLAEARYSKAIELFSATQDQYGLAEAQASLALVKFRLGKTDESEQMFAQAKAGYTALGAQQRAEEFSKKLQEISQQKSVVAALNSLPTQVCIPNQQIEAQSTTKDCQSW